MSGRRQAMFDMALGVVLASSIFLAALAANQIIN